MQARAVASGFLYLNISRVVVDTKRGHCRSPSRFGFYRSPAGWSRLRDAHRARRPLTTPSTRSNRWSRGDVQIAKAPRNVVPEKSGPTPKPVRQLTPYFFAFLVSIASLISSEACLRRSLALAA